MNTTPNNGSTDCSPQTGYCAPALPSPFARHSSRLEELEARNAARRAKMSHRTWETLSLAAPSGDEGELLEWERREERRRAAMKPHYYR